ncbi:ABC transporter substrate-binding protein [Rhabdothermincola sp.]|uniref:ABC transporter substrate-binding protein n=1 Tax=Rhabdothermincola sp. TaxID=2820405 RepID=UPI002FE002A9
MTDSRHPSVRPFAHLLAVVAALLLLTTACGGSGDEGEGPAGTVNQAAPVEEGPPTPGGTLKVAVGAEPDGLLPITARWSLEGNLIASSIYDTLMTFDEERNLVPHLAESMTPNDDGTVWTIKLRPNVVFHDGSPFDAAAVKINIDARRAVPITGTALKPIREVVVVDPLTVEVRMNTPWFGYDYTVAAQGGYMAAPAAIQANDSTVAIGTGPFKQAGPWRPGDPIRVTRNETYWGPKAHLDGIEFRAIVDQTSRAAALEAGDVDLILTQDPESVKKFRSTSGIVQVEDFAAEETFAMLNLAKPPFDNVHARRALAHATNRQAINDAVGGGIQKDADQPYTEDERYFLEDSGYPSYDLERAREEIATYTEQTGQPLVFTITTPSSNQQKAEAELLQAQWTALGMQVSIEVLEQGAFLAQVFGGQFQAAMFRNFAYVNPDSNYIFWHSSYADPSGGINFGGLRSSAVDRALDTARATADPDQRTAEIKQAVRAINDEVAFVWLYHNDWGLAARANVGGLSAPQRLGFARQDGKPWWPAIWLRS